MRTLFRLFALGMAIYGIRRYFSSRAGNRVVEHPAERIHNPMFYREPVRP